MSPSRRPYTSTALSWSFHSLYGIFTLRPSRWSTTGAGRRLLCTTSSPPMRSLTSAGCTKMGSSSSSLLLTWMTFSMASEIWSSCLISSSRRILSTLRPIPQTTASQLGRESIWGPQAATTGIWMSSNKRTLCSKMQSLKLPSTNTAASYSSMMAFSSALIWAVLRPLPRASPMTTVIAPNRLSCSAMSQVGCGMWCRPSVGATTAISVPARGTCTIFPPSSRVLASMAVRSSSGMAMVTVICTCICVF